VVMWAERRAMPVRVVRLVRGERAARGTRAR
jgi:hypothetical protein